MTSPLPFTRDQDDDVTLLKSHFDPGGFEVPVPEGEASVEIPTQTPGVVDPSSTQDDFPEHFTQLFLDTIEQTDFPLEAISGLKQLLIDHQHTFNTSSANI